MNIKSTFIWTTVHTVIKILAGIVMNKIIAVYLGPAGLAMIGQFQNFASVASGISNGSIQTGLLTQTAQLTDTEKQKKVWFNSLAINFIFTILTSLFIFIFAEWLSQKIFFSSNYEHLLYVFGITLIFYGLNLFIISILNGLGNIKLYTIINILISIFTLLLVSILTIFMKFEGAILGIILTQSVVFIISYLIIYKHYKNNFFKIDISMLDKSLIKTLLSYGLTSFSSGLIVAVTYMIVRAIIVNESSLEEAGLWEAALKIGLYFNMLFTLPISIYYLPKFSGSKNREEILLLIRQALLFFLPLMLVCVIIFAYTDEYVIRLLFSDSFLLITGFTSIILFSEILRVIIALFSNLLLAKRKLKQVIIFELLMGVIFVLYAYSFYKSYGLYGLSIGYFLVSCSITFIYILGVKYGEN